MEVWSGTTRSMPASILQSYSLSALEGALAAAAREIRMLRPVSPALMDKVLDVDAKKRRM
jgi:hypothetical protein